MQMRITERMDVPQRAIHARGHLEQPHLRGGFEVAGTSRLNATVPGLLQQYGKPADLELRARRHDEIRRAGARHEARLGVDSMDVLECARSAGLVVAIAARLQIGTARG